MKNLAVFVYMVLVVAICLQSCSSELPDEIAMHSDQLPAQIDYNIHVKPILSDRCFTCHGNDKNKLKAGLRLDNEEDALSKLLAPSSGFAIVPGKLSKSEVFHRILSEDPSYMMPPPESNLSLTSLEKAMISEWIEQGAKYKDHWAFLPPKNVSIKKKKSDWETNEIDSYVLSKLENKKWAPSKEADKATILRRLSFDLTGLPPTITDIERFENDKSVNAYEKEVDKLLNSKSYGERMAVEWMDLARFADTHGYTVDRFRDMSPWRDWVIKAFNENMPYDEFVTWQLAGDLLPNASREQIIATGFNRNHQQNMEGGIIGEEYRTEYVADRTNTFGTAFLGLTVECARCHDHKYDPISQKEYFQLFSFFNNVNEAGQISWNSAEPVPTIKLTDKRTDSIVNFIDEQIAIKEFEIREVADNETYVFWLENLEQDIQKLELSKPVAEIDFENELRITGKLQGVAKMKQEGTKDNKAQFVEGFEGKGLSLDGDAWLDMGKVGVLTKDDVFSIGLSLNLPENLENGVIFHKGSGAALYNFRGLHLAIKNNQLEVLMANTAPDNAFLRTGMNLPRNKWIHLLMTYDGSSKAEGAKIYVDGEQWELTTIHDELTKDILFEFGANEPGLQFGARYRGIGIKDAMIDNVKIFDRKLSNIDIINIQNPRRATNLIKKQIGQLSKEEQRLLKEHYRENVSSANAAKKVELHKLRRKKTLTLDTVPEMMVMKEMSFPRQSYLLSRGQYDLPAEKVFPTTIAAVMPFSEELPKNRLGLAKWLFDVNNPLTARVAVNRIWQQFFGQGLVKSAIDFGNQGDMPSHLELIDYLAMQFHELNWDTKALIKMIVMSSTYRQSSEIRKEMVEIDGDNVYLWRGPSDRLTAEMMRDNALFSSGLLHDKIGGKSVKPYQPAGLWSINGGRYVADSGNQIYRRSLYTFWKRSVPNPTQATFDAPNRSSCTITRQKTNTPLQALILLNDPAFTEASMVLGETISLSENAKSSISEAFAKLSGRYPRDEELEVLLQLQQEEYLKFKKEPQKMKGWLTSGRYQIDEGIEEALLAANTVVASAILNADATIYKR